MFILDRRKVIVLLLLCVLPGRHIHVRAYYYCDVGREKDGNNIWRWVLPFDDPCKCTSVVLGGMNTVTPTRPFHPVYVDNPLISNDIQEIRRHFGLQCKAPTVICPANQTQHTDLGQSTVTVLWSKTLPGDATEIAFETCRPGSESTFRIAKTKVMCEAHDVYYNTDPCYFYVNIIDQEDPTFDICPTSLVHKTDPGQPTAMVVYGTPSATDNSGDVTVTCEPTSESNFTIGDTAVVCEAVDSSGNKALFNFYVNVTDQEDPTFTYCTANYALETDPRLPTATVKWGPSAASDNSGNITATCDPKSGSNFTIGQKEVICEAIDNSGNKATCRFQVNVTDQEHPTFNQYPTSLVHKTDPGQPTAMVVYGTPSATDNSGDVTVTCDPSSESNFTIGDTEVVCQAVDSSGNKAVFSFYVNVTDHEDPKFHLCPTNLARQTDQGMSTAIVEWELPSAQDNSEDVNVTCNPISGSNFIIGQTEVKCVAIDNSENTAICCFHVNVTGTMDCISHHTDNFIDSNNPESYQHEYIWPQIPTGVTHFIFSVRAKNDVTIGLSSMNADVKDMYQIVLGGWGNMGSIIRRCKECGYHQTNTPGILSATEYRQFNISFEYDFVQVREVGESEAFMTYQNQQSYNVSYIGIGTGWGSDGDWIFCGYSKVFYNTLDIRFGN